MGSSEHTSGGCICVDGAFFAPGAARVPVRDHGVLFGDGLFETLRTWAGVPFRLDRHLARLEQGMGVLGFPRLELEWVRTLTLETIRRAELRDAYVRITVTRGESSLGLDPAGCDRPTLIISVLPLRPYPEQLYAEGIAAVRLWPRHPDTLPPPWVKTTSSQGMVLARAEIRRRAAQEGFFLDLHGGITEGSVSNVFALSGGVLVTPPASVCLPGITRAEVLDLARTLGAFELREEPLSPRILAEAEEVWVTSALAEILPVVRIDGQPVGTGAPGPIAARLRALYRERAVSGGDRG